MKISRNFRMIEGAQIFADIRTAIIIARKHGLNILETIALLPAQIIAHFLISGDHQSLTQISGGA